MSDDKRRDTRSSVLKRAKITFGNPDQTHAVIDCVLVNVSPSGARVRTAVATNVPEWVTLMFPDGATSRARRCWTRGNEIGFEMAESDESSLLDAMIAGLTPDQRRALIARIEASLVPKSG